MFGELLVGEVSYLGKAIHAFDNFCKDHASVVDLVADVVLFDDVGGKHGVGNEHVFGFFHGGHEIKVFQVEVHEFGVGGGDDAVHEEFESGKVGVGGSGRSVVLDAVAADGATYAVWIVFLGAIVGTSTHIGGFLPLGEVAWMLPNDGVCEMCGFCLASLSEACKFGGAGIEPSGSVRTLEEVTILLEYAGVAIEDGVGQMGGSLGVTKARAATWGRKDGRLGWHPWKGYSMWAGRSTCGNGGHPWKSMKGYTRWAWRGMCGNGGHPWKWFKGWDRHPWNAGRGGCRNGRRGLRGDRRGLRMKDGIQLT